ncbi:MAG TPA: NAD(P)H-dependent oxidoreductase subunit E [Candidatus Saccharimonadales bacterium]|nr:NAD(P)H-dependent oxidoreductase subunit E [Candidatus Saccharimonadales bacterium]
MDLHVIAPLPSPGERAAVDTVLGAAVTGWAGGDRDPRTEGHVAYGGHAARARRDLLLPALRAVQNRVGWVSEPALAYICRRLSVAPAIAYGVASFYALLATGPRAPAVAHVCDDIACRLAGAEDICRDLGRSLGPEGRPADDGRRTWHRSPCLGMCERAPAAFFVVAGSEPIETSAGPIDAAGILRRLDSWSRQAGAAPDARPQAGAAPDARPQAPSLEALRASIPQAGDPALRLIGRIGRIDPEDLAAYRVEGGYEGLRRAFELGPAGTIAEVAAARLVGRGGAAFPTARKWEAVASQPARPRYLVCNADESEPGTFKDRLLMEGDPFAILEGMTIAAWAAGAERGYVYLRGEYPAAAARLERAIAAATSDGLLGHDILHSGFSFEVEIRRGAGAYIAGEETALFESIEGDRAEPRNKPPFPVSHGLFGKPTAINNVETLANVPLILRGGGAAYATIGTDASTGPKLFCLSGHISRPGLYEVPFGTTLRSLIAMAGGVPARRAIQAILLGGAAGAFVGPDEVDVPLTFEGTRAIGATLGSGVVIVFDESADLIDTLLRIAAFFRDESCGQCVPCRVGTVRQEEALRRLANGRPNGSREQDLGLLREVGQAMRDASICGLGQTASSAIESALRHPGMVAL